MYGNYGYVVVTCFLLSSFLKEVSNNDLLLIIEKSTRIEGHYKSVLSDEKSKW